MKHLESMYQEKRIYNDSRNKSIQELETERSTLYDQLTEIELDPYGGWGSEEWEETYREVGRVEQVLAQKKIAFEINGLACNLLIS